MWTVIFSFAIAMSVALSLAAFALQAMDNDKSFQ
jgi:hypothetical protein